MKPMLSVIMPAYNAAAYIQEAVESVLAQSFTDFELLIINDGSTDDTENIIRSINDSRIVLINNEKNLGIIRARNLGLEKAKGKYIAKMDADDISLPQRFRKQIDYLEQHPEITLVAAKLVLINERGETTGIWPEDYYVSGKDSVERTLPVINCIGQSTVMARADAIKPVGYNKQFVHNEDWGLWLDLLDKGYSITKLNEVLVKYRVHSSSETVQVNERGVKAKILKFKFRYLKSKKFRINNLTKRIAGSMVSDVFQYFFPRFYRLLFKLKKTGVLKLIRQYREARRQLKDLVGSVDVIFIFPYYHTGGAERVHLTILETVAHKKTVTFITGFSSNDAFLQDFRQFTKVIDISRLVMIGPVQKWISKRICELSGKNLHAPVFGCNTGYFYELIPSLPASVPCIDLIHAFVHDYEEGPEKWSLLIVPRLNHRVIISRHLQYDFEKLYHKKNIPTSYLSRLVYISNYTDFVPYHDKNYSDDLIVLFVGRGSYEKRVHLISKAARIMRSSGKRIVFRFVGDVLPSIPEEDRPFCELKGELRDPAMIRAMYDQAHLLVITSSREGFPMVIMEGMMQGVVPVSTAVGGIPEHIKNGENGVLIKTAEEDEIVAELIATLDHFLTHRQELEALSRHAYQYAKEHFDKEKFFTSYQRLLLSHSNKL